MRPGEEPAGVGSGYPPAVVRLAGLPVSVLAGLRFSETAGSAGRLLATRAWLAAEGADLGDLLHPVIGDAAGSPWKPRLVGLRRSLHRVRAPAAAEWSPPLRQWLPPQLEERIAVWLEQLAQCRQDRADLAAVLEREWAEKAASLRVFAADAGFRRALWLSSPTLSAELDKWLDTGRRPRRQSLARLAKYVARAATKTSPHSAFAVAGLADWSPDGPPLRVASVAAWRGVAELPEQVRLALVAALLQRPELVGAARVRRNPSLTVENERVSFLGAPPTEPVHTLPLTGAVTRCLRELSTSSPLTVDQLVDRLLSDERVRTGTAAGADSVPDQRQAVAGFVAHLVAAGMLELAPPVPGSPPGIAALARWVADHGGAGLADVAVLLERLARLITEPVPVRDLPGFRGRQQELRDAIGRLAGRLQLPVPQQPAAAGPPAHDSVICADRSTFGGGQWRAALADLEQVTNWLAIFDAALPVRLAVAELWRERFRAGTRLPFLALHRLLHEVALGSDPRAEELRRMLSGQTSEPSRSSSFASVRELMRLRVEAVAPFRRGIHAGENGGGEYGEVRVPSERLAKLAAGWPAWVDRAGTWGCYLQPVADGRSVVLNMTSTGYGQGRTRVAFLTGLAGGGSVRAESGTELPVPAEPPAEQPVFAAPTPGQPVLAELAGGHGSNLNHRLAELPYEIDYPFTATDRPMSQRLPLNDLTVSYDPGRGLLRLSSERLGNEVRALALGLLRIPALPPAARTLALAFGDKPMSYSTGWPAQPPPAPTVRYRRRLAAGRVVLRRASWVTSPEAVPGREPGEDDAGYLLRLTGWRRGEGIPDRCFVRALPIRGDDSARMLQKSRKPVYVDFENWFLVLAFENLLRSSPGLLVFEEALPDPEHASEPAGAARAVEILLEMGARAG